MGLSYTCGVLATKPLGEGTCSVKVHEWRNVTPFFRWHPGDCVFVFTTAYDESGLGTLMTLVGIAFLAYLVGFVCNCSCVWQDVGNKLSLVPQCLKQAARENPPPSLQPIFCPLLHTHGSMMRCKLFALIAYRSWLKYASFLYQGFGGLLHDEVRSAAYDSK